ncbi:Rad52/22 double-strand break repair protein [Penicillium griseofulvum]|uniref:RAD52 homolog n=1 Tax=Penicillium patulum TaxID=5078 RepID=A0A135LU87_PENPA|nr:Rad52/22 double-strand break repair protein [Penicillium griseofulvum]KXG52522.1 Rad52/22 double-strand break repair protein [Penicillium griseofulvum]
MESSTDSGKFSVGDQHRGGAGSIMMPNATGATTANPFEEPQRRISEYTAQEIATLQARLDKKLGPEYISARPGAAGQKVHYLSADKCINLANEVFGFNGWSSSIQTIQIDFVEENQNTGKISLGLSVIMRVTLRDGTFHEDIGYGHIENCKGKAAAFEKAKKEGTTDALKRALRNFGNVLGNCIYDKDYVAKVTKVKAAPGKWDVEDLHRHPDFAPPKKQVPPPKRVPEEDDLPLPRPIHQARGNNLENISFEGDGEFGSDLFDEADFGVAETDTGNPDEIVVDTETLTEQQRHVPVSAPQRGPPVRAGYNSGVVTPSKPERWNGSGQVGRPNPVNAPQNASAIPSPVTVQGRPMGAQGAQNVANPRPSVPPQQPVGQNAPQNNIAQPPIKRDTGSGGFQGNQDMNPPQGTPSTGFFSARAVDLLRENPNSIPPGAPQFDPHAESPSIRKTAGVDHTKSIPIARPMLSGASPTVSAVSPAPPNNSTRDFVNPATDMQRRVGAPGGGVNSPVSRGPSVSSYRPLTRPNLDQRSVSNPAVVNRGNMQPQQNLNGKRPPLVDVTNADATPGAHPGAPASGPNDPKRPRVSDADSGASGPRPPTQ